MDEADSWMRAVLWGGPSRKAGSRTRTEDLQILSKIPGSALNQGSLPMDQSAIANRAPAPPPPLLKISCGEGLLLILRLPGREGIMRFYQPLWAPFVSLSMLTNQCI
jgi:hypothetical protein